MNQVLDVRETSSSSKTNYLYQWLKQLPQQMSYTLLLDEQPDLLMRSVSHQLRHRISWELIDQPLPKLWRVKVSHREESHIQGIIDLLTRDHLRLDNYFANALHATNRDDMQSAKEQYSLFKQGISAHLEVENELLVHHFTHHFDIPRSERGDDPTSIMLREHDSIEEQLTILNEYFDKRLPTSDEVAPYFGLISGTLAKHEGREETNLFPIWQACLNHDDDALILFKQVKQRIRLPENE